MVPRVPFPRAESGILRQIAKELDKRANLEIRGAQVELDRSVLEKITAPFEHLLRNCVTHDIGRGFRSFNGVAGSMFFRCKDWVIEDCEWGFVDIGNTILKAGASGGTIVNVASIASFAGVPVPWRLM